MLTGRIFYLRQRKENFGLFLLNEVESWQRLKMKGNDQKVLDAVLTLMKNIEDIEIFNKKSGLSLYERDNRAKHQTDSWLSK